MKNLTAHIIGGTGQMGNWLKNFLESQKVLVTISGSKGVSGEILDSADIIFISVPISKASEIIQQVSARVNSKKLLIDLSSTQQEAAKAMKNIPQGAALLHLLFGPTVSSIQNQKVILSRINDHRLINQLKNILIEGGAIVYEMDAKAHDKYMANIQNLTHFININLAKTLLEEGIDLSGKISTPPFLAQISAMSRIISQPPELLSEIQLGNLESKKVLEKFIKNQTEMLSLIKENNLPSLSKILGKVHSSIESTHSSKIVTKSVKGKIELEGKIGFLGPRGTFSEQASLLVAKANQLITCDSIYQIFQSVAEEKVDFGIVPAENSTEGTIRETLDFLVDFDLKTNGSVDLPIHQNLFSDETELGNISLVVSHPQALAQCRNWLQQHIPNAKIQSASSTVSAIAQRRNEKGIAFIGSELAAKLNKIKILKLHIEDNHENVTKFYIVSKKVLPTSRGVNKTLLFLTIYNRVGILRDMLSVFADNNVNLSKIESRPSREKVWDYHFFIEVEVSPGDPKLTDALNILKQYCPMIKVLGGV